MEERYEYNEKSKAKIREEFLFILKLAIRLREIMLVSTDNVFPYIKMQTALIILPKAAKIQFL
jgi:hypothetical protein